jgi:hypothetical protein
MRRREGYGILRKYRLSIAGQVLRRKQLRDVCRVRACAFAGASHYTRQFLEPVRKMMWAARHTKKGVHCYRWSLQRVRKLVLLA